MTRSQSNLNSIMKIKIDEIKSQIHPMLYSPAIDNDFHNATCPNMNGRLFYVHFFTTRWP